MKTEKYEFRGIGSPRRDFPTDGSLTGKTQEDKGQSRYSFIKRHRVFESGAYKP